MFCSFLLDLLPPRGIATVINLVMVQRRRLEASSHNFRFKQKLVAPPERSDI
jgi:hypothetical protein